MTNFNNNFYNNFGQNFNQRPASPLGGVKRFFTGKTMLSRLVIINIAVFIIVGLVRLVLKLYLVNPYQEDAGSLTVLVYWLAVPADVHMLLQRPWTLITYMFLHENLWHIFTNMIMLYVGGVIFTEYLGQKKLLLVYLLGGIMGAVFYIVSFNMFPAFRPHIPLSVALGASASVMAIIVSIAAYIPDYTIRLFLVGPVKFKWIAVFFVIYDLLTIEKSNPGGHIAHLGGACFGFVYILLLKKGVILRQLSNPFKKLFKRKPKVKTTYSRKPQTDDEFRFERRKHQQRIDDILDKIKKSGYESLSKEDKEYLFKESKNK
ncbi:MAG TPA: rhomboid family intramembrane serine protease [Bacteroidales bacterium]|nr:rhomboid family intramembrane serine protease [Bacteroidales bacterium]